MDLNFNKIIKKMNELHQDNPNLKFGNIIQEAIDQKKKKANFNLCDMSSKEILTSLENYSVTIKNKKKYRGNEIGD